MSDATKNLAEIYDDIDLCYKVMGLTFSDPPDQVDKVYHSLVDKYKRELNAANTELRQQAKINLDQVNDLYERITSSMIYKDYAREYEKYKQLKADEALSKKQKQEVEKETLMNCPHCNKRIPVTLKVCIYCNGKILSPAELMMVKLFSKRNVLVFSVVLLCIAAGIAFVTLQR